MSRTNFATFGNELYSGKRSYPFVARRNLWFLIAGIALLISIIIPVVKGGFNLGIDFRGGSEFTVSSTQDTDPVAAAEERRVRLDHPAGQGRQLRLDPVLDVGLLRVGVADVEGAATQDDP